MSTRTSLLAWALLSAACAGAPGPAATPAQDSERLMRVAKARLQAGAYAEAARLFEAVVRQTPPSPLQDQALAGLGRILVTPEYAGRDYRQAHAVFDRLVRQHPDSPHAAEARAWRELLGLYVALDQELQRRTHELQRRTQELLRRTQDLERLKRLDIELERPRSP